MNASEIKIIHFISMAGCYVKHSKVTIIKKGSLVSFYRLIYFQK